MPSRGAVLITNGRGRRTRARKTVNFSRVIANLKKNGSRRRPARKARKSTRARRKNGLAITNRRRNSKRRSNPIAFRTNSKRRRAAPKRRATSRRRKNGLAIRNGKRRGTRRRKNGLAIRNGKRRGTRRRKSLAIRNGKRRGTRRRKNSGGTRITNRRSSKGRFTKNRRGSKRRNSGGTRITNRRGSKRRRNGLAIQNRRRNGSRRRKNGLAISNPMSAGIFAKAQAIVRKVPIVGKWIAPIAVPAAAAALIVGGVHFALQIGVPYIPTMVAPYVAPIGYTLGGAALSLIVAFIPSSILSPASKKAIAGLAIVGGGAVDGIRYLTSSSDPTSIAGLGSGGGLWQLAGDDSDPDAQAVRQRYADASLFDAQASGTDFDGAEGEALLSGARGWASRFPVAMRNSRTLSHGASRHAGEHGHRWGWLINAVGFQRTAAIAQMRPAQRLPLIARLRKGAIATASEQVSSGSYGATMYAQ